ncbi:MAG TPA: hypothetical protein VFV67_07380 [Actinophytocola sp.]|uniref:hypothetical protein n=1 Tax=Actinophytocola sp. TaxID=1872138 RepID=UPI002DB98EE4|nr:hypothetical protein [Actinophytocola sp.]HEU5470458.1 hypothetical protein [Actinophytocola sp.]
MVDYMTSGAGGFQVVQEELHGAVRELPNQAKVLDDTRQALVARQVPASAFANVDASAQAGAAHARTVEDNARALAASRAELDRIISEMRGTAATVRDWDKAKADQQVAQGADRIQAGGDGSAGDGSAGRPTPAMLNEANRQKVADARDQERQVLDELRQGMSLHHQGSEADRARAIADSEQRIQVYDHLLAGDAKILRFDPAGDGRIVTAVGELNADTRNVAVFMPGADNSMNTYPYQEEMARTFVDRGDAAGGITSVVWMDGSFPPVRDPGSLRPLHLDGLMLTSAEQLGADVRQFVNTELRPMVGADTRVSVIAHSYAGAALGFADRAGLNADAAYYLAVPGIGIPDPANLSNDYGTVRYATVAPNDPVGLFQGGWFHGASPADIPGVVVLDAGRDRENNVVSMWDVHNSMYDPGSESWVNVYNVITNWPDVTATP